MVVACKRLPFFRLSTSTTHFPPSPESPLCSAISTTNHTAVPSSTLISIFDAASNEYKKKTGQDLRGHPFADKLDSSDFADAILAVFETQVDALNQVQRNLRTCSSLHYRTALTRCKGFSSLYSEIAFHAIIQVSLGGCISDGLVKSAHTFHLEFRRNI